MTTVGVMREMRRRYTGRAGRQFSLTAADYNFVDLPSLLSA